MCASDIDRVKDSCTSAIWRWLSWNAITQGLGPQVAGWAGATGAAWATGAACAGGGWGDALTGAGAAGAAGIG
jgi:hypothetical protein